MRLDQLQLGAMSPTIYLAAINCFTGDIQGGLGPFLSTWLAANEHWNPSRIGLLTTLVGLIVLFLNGPAGAIADHTRRPRLQLALACGAILVGTLLILPAHGMIEVMGAQLLAAAGGALLLPALTLLTLGIVGKQRFPRQQGRNQAFNHVGILSAALLISQTSPVFGAGAAFWVLGGMAIAALMAVAITPASAFNGRRAHGWQENEPDETEHRHPLRDLLHNGKLLLLATLLALFNLSNGTMLSLLGQRLVENHHNATSWTATYVVAAQLTMIPVALCAGSLAERVGRRHLLMLACIALAIRAVLCALITNPFWLVLAETLDGFASGLIGVVVPVLVADLTWGGGRTQTALGAVNSLQGLGGALSGSLGGSLVVWFAWKDAFLLLGVPALVATGFAFWLKGIRGMDAA